MDAQSVRRVARIREAIAAGNRLAGILHQRSVLRMQERALALAEERKPHFIHRGCAKGPGMRDVQLLRSLVRQIAKTRQRGAARLEPGKRFREVVLREIVITCQMLVLCQFVVDLHSELITSLVPQRHRLRCAIRTIRLRNILVQKIERGLVHAGGRNLIILYQGSASSRLSEYPGTKKSSRDWIVCPTVIRSV